MNAKEIAKLALGCEWEDTESAARRVAEKAEELMAVAQMVNRAREHGMDLGNNPVAYEFYNKETGHAIVDYTRWTHAGHLTDTAGYEARPLVYASEPKALTLTDEQWEELRRIARTYNEKGFPKYALEFFARASKPEAPCTECGGSSTLQCRSKHCPQGEPKALAQAEGKTISRFVAGSIIKTREEE
jgi:hypothetical protein